VSKKGSPAPPAVKFIPRRQQLDNIEGLRHLLKKGSLKGEPRKVPKTS